MINPSRGLNDIKFRHVSADYKTVWLTVVQSPIPGCDAYSEFKECFILVSVNKPVLTLS